MNYQFFKKSKKFTKIQYHKIRNIIKDAEFIKKQYVKFIFKKLVKVHIELLKYIIRFFHSYRIFQLYYRFFIAVFY